MTLKIQTNEAQGFSIYEVACERGFVQLNDVRTAVIGNQLCAEAFDKSGFLKYYYCPVSPV